MLLGSLHCIIYLDMEPYYITRRASDVIVANVMPILIYIECAQDAVVNCQTRQHYMSVHVEQLYKYVEANNIDSFMHI